MTYRLPAGIASIRKNPNGPARLTGARWPWIAEIEGRITYCDSRQSARDVVATYRATRARLLAEGARGQARAAFRD